MPRHLIAEEGPHRGLTLNLEEGTEWIIGRDPSCNFVIEDSTVSRKHVLLTKTDAGISLKNLNSANPVAVNSEIVAQERLLKEGDRVQIGNTILLYSEKALPPSLKKKGGYDDIFGDIEEPPQEMFSTPEEPSAEPEPAAIEPEELRIPPAPPKPEMTAYDTIFEDTGNEEDLSFNLIPKEPLMLKVIAGPNAGAEIGIEQGKTYILGKDPNACEIVFQDLSVSRQHARLTVHSDGVIDIEDLGSKNGVAVNGALLTEKKVVTPQDLIALGTTIFMIIDREAPQETIYSPTVPLVETVKPAQETQAPEETSQEMGNWKQQPIPMKYLVAGGSAVAIFLIMFLSFFSLFKSKGMEVSAKEPVSEIQEALSKFTDVQYSFNPSSGKLFLVGHVLTSVDYEEMKYRLSQIDFIASVEDHVVIDEGVWKTMNDIITNNPAWRGVSIHSPEAGKFVVNGYIPTLDEGGALYEYLTVNFPYLDRLENNVVIEQTLSTQIQSILTEANVGGVTFQLSNGNVILSGNYSENMQTHVKKLVKEINALKGVTSVKNYAVALHPSKVGFDISQDYRVTGTSLFDGRGYSVVLNGKIYTLGDWVDGMKLVSIEPTTILLEKDGLKYKINYTR